MNIRLTAALTAALLAAGIAPIQETVDPAPFAVDAAGYVLMEASAEQVLAGEQIHKRLAMASTTKIMTAWLALESEDPDEYFTVDETAIRVEGSSMGLLPGDRVSLRTLAAGMLLASGNDAANAAAVRISGSVEAFVNEMNDRAKKLGLADTCFETPSGLDGEAHYSTASDMARLAKAALSNEDFRAICSQRTMTVSYGRPPVERRLTNHNRLLSSCDGCMGVKTGFTRKAGRCLVSAAERDGITLICVTLSASDDWNVHEKLFDWGFSRLEKADLTDRLAGLTVPVAGEDQPLPIETAQPVRAIIPAGRKEEIELQVLTLPFYYRPIGRERRIGEARFYLDGELLCSADLFPARDLPLPKNTVKQSFFRRLFGETACSNLTP